MKDLYYVLAVILFFIWAIGVLGYHYHGLYHLFLISSGLIIIACLFLDKKK